MTFKTLTYKISLTIIVVLFFNIIVFSQARLVLGNGTAVYMNITGGAYLIVGDATASANPNTITTAANAWIISEGDGTTNNRIKWFIGNAAASTSYTVPFGRTTANYIPLSLTIGVSGTAGGAFVFSTYRTANCTNSANLPTTGTNPPTDYNSASLPGDASNYGVDRFWEIDGTSYGATKPDLSSLIFTYRTAEVTGVTCTNTGINETNLQAQRWNSNASPPSWQGPGNTFIKGTSTPASNIVTLSGAGVVSGANDIANSRWWTLQDNTQPLPITWLSYSATCNNKGIEIKWSTALEQNADFFTLEKSNEGTYYTPIANIPASGNSNVIKNYSYLDTDPFSGVSYYRIRETDFNSSSTFSELMTVNGCSNDYINISHTYGGIVVTIESSESSNYNFEIFDAIGKKILDETKNIFEGHNVLDFSLSNLASSIYIVKVYNHKKSEVKKIFALSSY